MTDEVHNVGPQRPDNAIDPGPDLLSVMSAKKRSSC